MNRRQRPFRISVIAVVIASLLAAACGGSGGGDESAAETAQRVILGSAQSLSLIHI